MSFHESIPPELTKLCGAFLGSLMSLRWLPGGWIYKLQMLIGGVLVSSYVGDMLAHWSGMNAGAAGFLTGVFGIAVLDKLFELLRSTPWGAMLEERLRPRKDLP